ncbi:MAG: hypothetical protein ONB55_21805 [candidate division KSB1 bacterium]|nr:hypothetical protein [candidate division KSB1 bacterium]
MTIEEMKGRFMDSWPDRILLDDTGRAEAVRRSTGTPDFVLIRKDGWSLGVTEEFLATGVALWLDEWVQVFYPHQPNLYPVWDFLAHKFPDDFEQLKNTLEKMFEQSALSNISIKYLEQSTMRFLNLRGKRVAIGSLPSNWLKLGYLAERSDLKIAFPVEFILTQRFSNGENTWVCLYIEPGAGMWFGKRMDDGLTTQPFSEWEAMLDALVNTPNLIDWSE